MKELEKCMLAALLICGTTMLFPSCSDKDVNSVPSNPEESKVTDYSQTSRWFQIPVITKGFDTFYIPATEYISSSYNEGAPEFATLDNAEMQEGIAGEYLLQASVFEESTNVFVPYYRQAGLKKEVDAWKPSPARPTPTSLQPSTTISGTTTRGARSSSPVTAKARQWPASCCRNISRSTPTTTSA